jgi:hypothetical protein
VISSGKFNFVEHVAGKGERAYRVLVGKLEGKRPLGRLRSRWKDSIKINVKSVERV